MSGSGAATGNAAWLIPDRGVRVAPRRQALGAATRGTCHTPLPCSGLGVPYCSAPCRRESDKGGHPFLVSGRPISLNRSVVRCPPPVDYPFTPTPTQGYNPRLRQRQLEPRGPYRSRDCLAPHARRASSIPAWASRTRSSATKKRRNRAATLCMAARLRLRLTGPQPVRQGGPRSLAGRSSVAPFVTNGPRPPTSLAPVPLIPARPQEKKARLRHPTVAGRPNHAFNLPARVQHDKAGGRTPNEQRPAPLP